MTTDPRPTRTHNALIAAATDILTQHSPNTPSISALVQAAGVSRPTFYQHFTDPLDLIRTTALTRLQDSFNALPEPQAQDLPNFAETITTALLNRLHADATFYRNALTLAGDAALFRSLNTFLAQRLLTKAHARQALENLASEELREEYSRFIAAGISWTVIRWLHTDFTGSNSVPAMSTRLTSIILTSLGHP